jgi:acyl carrier protein
MSDMREGHEAGDRPAGSLAVRDRLRRDLRELAAQSLCVPEAQVPFDAELPAMGLDSVLAVEFVLRVSEATGTELTVPDLRQYPTIDLLADFLDAA